MLRAYRLLLSALCAALLLTGCTLSGEPVEEAVPQISGAPVVRIAAPLTNATYLEGVGVNVQIAVSNAGADIDRIEVSLDGVIAATLPDPNPTGAPSFGVTQTFTAEGVGAHTVEARAFREDGTVSEAASVSFNVVAEIAPPASPTPTNTVPPTERPTMTAAPTDLPTNTPAVTNTLVPTTTGGGSGVVISTTAPNTTPVATTGVVATTAPNATPAGAAVARFEGAVNVRRGPSTNFIPPIGTFNAGQTTPILALNTDGTWLKVSFNGGEGWILRTLVRTEGAVDSLPREAGPPIPTLPPATAVPPTSIPPTAAPGTTAVPATAAPTGAPSSGGPNLVVTAFELRQINGGTPVNDISLNQPSIAFVRIKNTGDRPATGFFVVLTIVNASDGGFKLVEAAAVGGLAPNEEQLIQIGFTDIAGQGLQKAAVARVDENNQVGELNEGDNASQAINYTLR
jgi:hypothetical protein